MDNIKWAEEFNNHLFWEYKAGVNYYVVELVCEKFKDSTSHHGIIIMLYGLSLECYLKSKAIKRGYYPLEIANSVRYSIEFTDEEEKKSEEEKYEIVREMTNENKSDANLDKNFTTHNIKDFYEYCIGIPDEEARKYLENLDRGIRSGKYHVEKKPSDYSYLENFHETVKFCKDLIGKVKNL